MKSLVASPRRSRVFINFEAGQGEKPTDEQVKLLIQYVQYHISAPCWARDVPGFSGIKEKTDDLRSLEDIEQYIAESVEIGLDPF